MIPWDNRHYSSQEKKKKVALQSQTEKGELKYGFTGYKDRSFIVHWLSLKHQSGPSCMSGLLTLAVGGRDKVRGPEAHEWH